MALSDDDVREILRIIDESELDELRIDTDGFSLHVVKGQRAAAASDPRVATAPPAASDPRVATAPPAASGPPAPSAGPAPPAPAPDAPPPAAAPPVAPPAAAERSAAVTITAPMLGTFYRAQAPGAPPFVDPGSRVDPDTIVCIIEVMKMMNSIPAGVAGVVAEVLAENAELVEYGAPLFRVAPE